MVTGNALLLVPVLFVVVAVGWSPVLISERVRSLFEGWPTRHLALNYPVVVALVVVAHVVLLFVGAIPAPSGSLFVLQWGFATTLLVPLAGWVLVVVGLPRIADVDLPDGVWLPLGVGAVWYAIVVAFAFAVLAFLLFVFFFPG